MHLHWPPVLDRDCISTLTEPTLTGLPIESTHQEKRKKRQHQERIANRTVDSTQHTATVVCTVYDYTMRNVTFEHSTKLIHSHIQHMCVSAAQSTEYRKQPRCGLLCLLALMLAWYLLRYKNHCQVHGLIFTFDFNGMRLLCMHTASKYTVHSAHKSFCIVRSLRFDCAVQFAL